MACGSLTAFASWQIARLFENRSAASTVFFWPVNTDPPGGKQRLLPLELNLEPFFLVKLLESFRVVVCG